jgi:TRAP-type C4-dicarboxylate transport system permease small subunit
LNKKVFRLVSYYIALGLPMIMSSTAFADGGSVTQVESFIQSIIKIVAGLAGLIATGFFVVGGLKYITSSGDPRHLDQAKRTIIYSAIGLSITIAAFVISDIVSGLASNAFGS